MYRVEIQMDGENQRHYYKERHHAEEWLIDFVREELGVRPASADAATEALLDSDRVAWCSFDEITNPGDLGACPRCDNQGGWGVGYCEPCGYTFPEDANADE